MSDNQIDVEEELGIFREKVEDLIELNKLQSELDPKGKEFAESLHSQFLQTSSLSPRQWEWVGKLLSRVKNSEPIYGNFNAVLVMFRIAGANEHGNALKKPKVRLLTKNGRYVQLNFNPEETKTIKVYVDGYAGHGYRKYAGEIHDNSLIPYDLERMDEDVRLCLQEFSLDPIATAKAMAGKLGVCMYCGQRLTDEVSKKHGYGPVCAVNWGLEWEGKLRKKVEPINLESLFN